MPFMERDLEVDDEGDLVVASNGDLSLATERRTLVQDLTFRLKTDALDYAPAPFIGADLSSLLGEPNTARTADLAKEKAHIALTQDGRVPVGVLHVDAVPLDIHLLELFIVVSDRIGNETDTLVVTRTLELEPSGEAEEDLLAVDE